MSCQILRDYCQARDAGDHETAAKLEGRVLEEHVGLAKTYATRGRWGDRDDHVQAAAVGLLGAVRSFDPDRGSTLSSFAWPHMRTESAKESARQAVVRVPKGRWQAGARAVVVDDADHHIDHEPDDSEDDLLVALDRAASCWRAASLGSDPAETMTRAAVALAALGGAAWPADHDRRLSVLARLDAAVEALASEHPVDATLWRRHHLEGELWGALAVELGVTRQRVSARSRRRQGRLAEILGSLEQVEDDVLEVWASPTPAVQALRLVGLLTETAGPVETAYMAEDLEVALTEIGASESRSWTMRYIEQRSVADVAHTMCVGQRDALQLIDRGSIELARLLRSDAEPEQLELLLVEPTPASGAVETVTWFSPIIGGPPSRHAALDRDAVLLDLPVRRSSRRPAASRPQAVVFAADLRGVGPPAVQLQLM